MHDQGFEGASVQGPGGLRDEVGSCFDATRAEFPTRVLPVEDVVDPLPLSHAPERIEQYRAAMASGDRFPPIAVVRIGRRFFVADGHKRFSAFRALNGTEILVEVWTIRRWLRDQWGQFAHTTSRQVSLALRSLADAEARREVARLAVDTAGHWRRVARSLRAHLRRAGR